MAIKLILSRPVKKIFIVDDCDTQFRYKFFLKVFMTELNEIGANKRGSNSLVTPPKTKLDSIWCL